MKALKFVIGFCLASVCFLGSARAQSTITLTANFDNLPESILGASFSDDGIGFSNLDEGFPNGVFAIQSATNTIPGFSPPNYLTFGAFASGGALSFGRFSSMSIDLSRTGLFASLDIFGPSFMQQSNTLTLEAILNGNVVNSDTVTLNGPVDGEIVYETLSVSGTFDSLALVAAGPESNGDDFIGMDNVTLTVVPEPPAGRLVCSGLIGLVLARWRRRRMSFR
jgi:hypothetical protein